jgi:tricarballylate dehydrogenase
VQVRHASGVTRPRSPGEPANHGDADVVVVGAGNAALCSALAAAEAGASVIVLEAAPAAEAGGNSAFTAGAMRVAYDGAADLGRLIDLEGPDLAGADFGSYPVAAFQTDLQRLSAGRGDPALAGLVAERSMATMLWMRDHGVAFEANTGRQSAVVEGRLRFWGGLAVRVAGEGQGLLDRLGDAVAATGATIQCSAPALGLLTGGDGEVNGVVTPSGPVRAAAVVLACGGFEADPEWRAAELGPAWRMAKVRGTRFNRGDGLRMALAAGAARNGDWSGCHAVAWDRSAPDVGDLDVRHEFSKNSFQLGITVNRDGRRFLDEGADFRNYTYATYGRAVLDQPGAVAWQLFDDQVAELLHDEYSRPSPDRVVAASLDELVGALDGMHGAQLRRTIAEFNQAVRSEVPFDPTILDGRGTAGLVPPKSNWANCLQWPPFRAYAVTCGITFTFGGLAVDTSARVLRDDGSAVGGLFGAGELVGGLFWGNYPGGSGLTAGSVLGRIAGTSAARYAATVGSTSVRPVR